MFGERLATYLPSRVLPISTDAPEDLSLLLDEEVSQIAELLKPNHRAREQARARIRTLLAMQLHQEPDTRVSDEVARAETGIRQGKNRAEVFPKQESLGAEVSGTGINVTVHFSEKGEGAAVRYVSDDSEEAAAIRGAVGHRIERRLLLSARDATTATPIRLNSPSCVPPPKTAARTSSG